MAVIDAATLINCKLRTMSIVILLRIKGETIHIKVVIAILLTTATVLQYIRRHELDH